jgi:two-component system response regulator RegX3
VADRILVVEDDEDIRDLLAHHLRGAGYEVLAARDGVTGLRLALTARVDLVLLDLMLPGMSGMDLCRNLRRSSRVPVIMLTARDTEVDTVLGLEVGADDYVTKPFSVREVLARINAVIRRSRSRSAEQEVPEREQIGNFVIDRAARRVLVDGVEVKLTAREFELLSHLVARSGRVQSREALIQQVWGVNFMGDRKTVDVHVRWLREKFAGRVPFELVTVRGAGYRLDRLDAAPVPTAPPVPGTR